MIYPRQVALHGILGGEYGVATLGWIIEPNIVSRFPHRATVSDHPDLTLVATADGGKFDLVATVTDGDPDC